MTYPTYNCYYACHKYFGNDLHFLHPAPVERPHVHAHQKTVHIPFHVRGRVIISDMFDTTNDVMVGIKHGLGLASSDSYKLQTRQLEIIVLKPDPRLLIVKGRHVVALAESS